MSLLYKVKDRVMLLTAKSRRKPGCGHKAECRCRSWGTDVLQVQGSCTTVSLCQHWPLWLSRGTHFRLFLTDIIYIKVYREKQACTVVLPSDEFGLLSTTVFCTCQRSVKQMHLLWTCVLHQIEMSSCCFRVGRMGKNCPFCKHSQLIWLMMFIG